MPRIKRKEQKEQTKKLLVEAAINAFTDKGIALTRTIDIAKAASVSHGSVFAHFTTREDLLNIVIEEFGRRVAGRIHELAVNGRNLREVLQAHLTGLKEFERFYIRLVKENDQLPVEARNTLLGIQSAISFHLNKSAEHEMAEGKIRRIPFHLFFNTWIGLIHYYLANNNLFAPEGSVIERYGEELLDHYLNLIKK